MIKGEACCKRFAWIALLFFDSVNVMVFRIAG
jgi:hypothetical protein